MDVSRHATLTVRLIRSFEHRNIKHLVFTGVNLDQTAEQFMELVNKDMQTRTGLPPPFRKFCYGTMKIHHKAHCAKSSDPVINTDRDDQLFLKKHWTLRDNGVEHETEISYFRLEDYLKYKENPHLVW